jgi:membrane protein
MLLLAPFRLVSRAAQRFVKENCIQAAAALSFETLLGLVPMLFVSFVLISQIPPWIGLGSALEKFLLANLLPDKAGTIIAKYVGQFVMRAERVTFIGIAILAVTAFMQMITIERTFNRIWKVKASRPILRRILMYGIGLPLGPVVFGASLVALSYVVSQSLGLVDQPRWVDDLVLREILPFISLAAFFGLLYWVVPHKDINPWHAGFGGIMAALGFTAMQKLFALYISSVSVNTMVYGAFSALPVFLTWLYLSWGVILLGALLVAELPNSARG